MARHFFLQRTFLVCCAALCGAAAIACDGKSPIAPDSSGRAVPAPGVVKELRIDGNHQLAGPNDRSQFRALATLSDGTVSDVTQRAEWQASGVLGVSNTGLVRAFAFGVGDVTVRYGALRRTVGVRAMPGGSYVVAGFVREPGALPVAGAVVMVTDGRSAGKSTRTDAYGRFTLTPVDGGPVALRLSADGYTTAIRHMTLSDDLPELELMLSPNLAPLDLSGDYQMTLDVASACQLPDEVRTRHYRATISQDGARLAVKLSGADFLPCYTGHTGGPLADHFIGRVSDRTHVSFQIGWDDQSCIHDVNELITPTSYLQFFNGTVAAGATERTIAGEFDTEISLREIPQEGQPPRELAACARMRHGIKFTR